MVGVLPHPLGKKKRKTKIDSHTTSPLFCVSFTLALYCFSKLSNSSLVSLLLLWAFQVTCSTPILCTPVWPHCVTRDLTTLPGPVNGGEESPHLAIPLRMEGRVVFIIPGPTGPCHLEKETSIVSYGKNNIDLKLTLVTINPHKLTE